MLTMLLTGISSRSKISNLTDGFVNEWGGRKERVQRTLIGLTVGS
jgi:hypothetical protein